MTVKDLADKLEQRVKDVLKKLLDKRLMMTINSTVDTDTASMIAREFGAELQLRTFEQDMLEVEAEDVKPEDTVTRAPGRHGHGPRRSRQDDAARRDPHDARRRARSRRHYAAHRRVSRHDRSGRNIVFLDTPGHEAFTLMRARGAKVTDVVVLVVAADDGVMPQTREAIDHAKAANVPIIVAINKIDKPGADPERVKRELADLNLVPEDWGGQTVMVPVSAKKKTGLDTLLEMILLVSDIGEYKANPKRNASGTVLESKLDRGRGPVATDPGAGRHAARRRHVHRGPDRRPRARAHRRPRQAHQVGAAVDAGRSARPDRPAAARRRVPGDDRRGQGAADCHLSPGHGEGKGARRERQPPDARVAAAADRRRQHEGPADHHQVRRAGLGRSARRHAGEAERRPSAHQDHPLGRRRHQRIRRAAGIGVERHHHRVQRAARPQRRGARRARRGRHPPSHGHLQRDRRDEEGDDRPARADAQGSAAGRGRSARTSSRCRRPGTIAGCYGHRRPHHAQRRYQGAADARRRRWCTKARSARCAASRTT